MTLSMPTALGTNHAARPSRELARPSHDRVSLLALAQQLSADKQLEQALRIPGTALVGIATDGVPLMIRLASPDVTHLLVTGAKGSGKTRAVRATLASIALFQKARDIQFVVLDPSGGGFEFLTRTPHLLGDIATTPERALLHLRWLENELERR